MHVEVCTVQLYCHICIQLALEQVIGELTAKTRPHTWGHSGLHKTDSGGRFMLNEKMNKRMNEGRNESMSEWMDGWMDEWTREQVHN